MSLDHDYSFANSSKNQTMTNRVQDARAGHVATASHLNNGQERRAPVQQIQYIQQDNVVRTIPVQRPIIQRVVQTTSNIQDNYTNFRPMNQNIRDSSTSECGTVRQYNSFVPTRDEPPYRGVPFSVAPIRGTISTPTTQHVYRGVSSIQTVQDSSRFRNQPQVVRPVVSQYQVPNTSQSRNMNLAVPLREPSPVKQNPPQAPPQTSEKPEESTSKEEPVPEGDIDIQIHNVVCNYTLPLHIDLRKLAMCTNNVTYEREKGVMMKQKRSPSCYVKLYSSGKVYIVGCRSEEDCRKASRSIARHVQKVMGKTNERIAMRNYKINNVLATCRMPFGIKIEEVAAKYPTETEYEPELSVGLVWKSVNPKATLRIHTTGSITVTGATSEEGVLEAIGNIYNVVVQFRCQDRAKGSGALKRKRRAPQAGKPPVKKSRPVEYGTSGIVEGQVYFSDEDEGLYDDLEFDD